MLYLQPAWLEQALDSLQLPGCAAGLPSIGSVLNDDPELARATLFAFNALHKQDVRMVRDVALDTLLERLAAHLYRRPQPVAACRAPLIARQARDYLMNWACSARRCCNG